LFSGERRRKDDLLFETLGDGDELVSRLGVSRAETASSKVSKSVYRYQKVLFRVQAMVATAPSSEAYRDLDLVTDADIAAVEKAQSDLMKSTKVGEAFVVPGETRVSASLDVARSVCRRFERRIVRCIRDRGLTHLIPCQQYVNRLSDYLFVLARYVEQHP
jgi:cob(I)alamin adenosyltransferase